MSCCDYGNRNTFSSFFSDWKEKYFKKLLFRFSRPKVIDVLGVGIVGRSNPPIIDSLGYRCNKSDPEYPGDEWLKFLEFNFNEEGKLVTYYEVKVPYPVPH